MVKFWSKSQMLWGDIKGVFLRKLVKIDGNLYNGKYILLLKDILIPDVYEGEIFQYDRAPCHSKWRSYCIESLASLEP